MAKIINPELFGKENKMKERTVGYIAILALIVVSYTGGYLSNSGRYDIVDRQDKLVEVFEVVQAEIIKDEARIVELNIEANVLNEMSADESVENLAKVTVQLQQIVTEADSLGKILNENRLLRINLRFTYKVLQDMR